VRRGTFTQRKAAGVGHLLKLGSPQLARIDSPLVSLTRLLPPPRHLPFDMVREQDVSVVLDASGFAYSDQWGPRYARATIGLLDRWHGPERAFVLLPQAFGPFDRAEVRDAVSRMLEKVDLVFARDSASLEYLRGLQAREDHVRLAPDFTNLLEPARKPEGISLRDRVAVIPNLRMVDKGAVSDEAQYVREMVGLVETIQHHGVQCVIVTHERNDVGVASRIASACNSPLVSVQDPLQIKALLGEALLVLSSRYHGLASALAQGTPSVAVGWSHKYLELLRDYDALDCLGVSLALDGDVVEMVKRELSDTAQAQRRASLSIRATQLKDASREMWRQVFSVIRDKSGR
jgi:polysaccharide pyruvyl transferase WcaK-like protein